MKTLKIYIAASWAQEFGVRLLAEKLRQAGHEVFDFTQGDAAVIRQPGFDFETWLAGPGQRKQQSDLEQIQNADLVIYLGPGGMDAWAEIGFAHGVGTPVWGLLSPKEQIGINRAMLNWFHSIEALFIEIGRWGEDCSLNEGAEPCPKCGCSLDVQDMGKTKLQYCINEFCGYNRQAPQPAPCGCEHNHHLGGTSPNCGKAKTEPTSAPATSPLGLGGGASYPGSGI